MSIRWKLLIVLLIFSVSPLLVFIAVNQRAARQLQEAVSGRTAVLLARIIGKDLQQTAQDFAKILSLEMHAVEMALKDLARDAERSLTENATATTRIFFIDDFDNPLRAPDDLNPSSKFIRQVTPIENSPIAVSLEHQVFLLAPGIDRQAVEMDIVRLSRLIGLHQELEHEFGERIYWQYVSLANGIQAIYPGHGSNLRGYAVDSGSWFKLTKKRGRLDWNNPYIDAASGQTVITASIPFRRPDGTFAGVAAIDFPILKVLQLDVPPSQWSRHTHFFLIHSKPKHTSGELGFRILAKQDEKQTSAWSGNPKSELLVSSNHAQMKRFFDDFQINESGLTKMPFEGEDSIWAYAHVGGGIGLVLIIPEKIIDFQLTRTHKRVIRWRRLDTLVSATAVIIILAVIVLWRSRVLINPFLDMVKAVRQLAGGDFSARMDFNTGDERDLVASAFNKMVPQLEDRMRMHKALGIAQEVQQNLLPDENPDFPGFDIAGKSVYCDETGGDYFDFLPCGEEDCGRLGIVVGDVSDHGIGAALLMATARALIRSLSVNPEDLAQRITRMNRLLSADVQHTGNFMTLFYLEITAGSRTIRWVRAGNDPAILYDATTERFEELTGPGLVLGVDEGYLYKQFERIITPRKTIILIGTDGIWETQNSEGEMFGKQRLYEILKSAVHESAREIQDRVLKALTDFREDMAQEDDVTIVIIKSV